MHISIFNQIEILYYKEMFTVFNNEVISIEISFGTIYLIYFINVVDNL